RRVIFKYPPRVGNPSRQGISGIHVLGGKTRRHSQLSSSINKMGARLLLIGIAVARADENERFIFLWMGGKVLHMSKRTILVVDDDRSVRGYLSDFLTSCGHIVECLESGDQALARLAAGNIPSLLVLDVVMPGMSGLEVLDNLRKMNSMLPVIVLSGIGQTKTVVDA